MPATSPGAAIVPGGTGRNLEAAEGVEWADDLSETDRILCADAQTSGGLLLAVPPENEAALLAGLRAEKTPAAAAIGRLTPGPAGQIRVGPIAVAFASMSPLRWTAQRMDQLEHAARNGRRVALMRRGTEFIVVALRVTSAGRHEVLVGLLPMTGEELTFRLDEIDAMQVLEYASSGGRAITLVHSPFGVSP